MLVEQLELIGARTAVTPGVDATVTEIEVDAHQELDGERATQYRRLVAGANYIAGDRADAHYATKELCREMSCPNEASWSAPKRLVRYFKDRPRAVLHFEWQPLVSVVDVYTDANWAGCK